MATRVGIVEVCANCGKSNRIPFAALSRRALCGECQTPIREAGTPIEVDDHQLAELMRVSPVPVLVDFWAEWCGPCRELGPALDQAARRLPTELIVAKLNVEQNQGAVRRYGARAIPLLLLFVRGEPVWRATGLRTSGQLERELRAALAAVAGPPTRTTSERV